jgi:hypothetical protein
MNIKNTTLYERYRAETPLWFKQIRRVGITLGAIAAALLAANGSVGFVLPEILNAPCQWITVAGITSAAIATTAKK